VENDRLHEEEQREIEKAMKEKLMPTIKEQPIADFLESINYKSIDSSLGIQLKQMLHKYTMRKMRLEEREKEVSISIDIKYFIDIKYYSIFNNKITIIINKYLHNFVFTSVVESYIQRKTRYIYASCTGCINHARSGKSYR